MQAKPGVFLKVREVRSVCLTVFVQNTVAMAFYDKLGFKQKKVVRDRQGKIE